MVQEKPTKGQTTILILGTARSENQDFFSKLNSFSLLRVQGEGERTILNIPAWPFLVVLVAFCVAKVLRSKRS